MTKLPTDPKQDSTIIPRPDHNVSRKLISENAIKVLRRLNRYGYTAYLAGGGVRDIVLGREPKDFDIVTSATPEEIKKVFRNALLIGRRFRIAHIRFHNELIEVSTFRALQKDEEPQESQESRASGIPEEEADTCTDADTDSPEEETGRRGRIPIEGRLQSEGGLILRDNVWGSPEEDAFRRDFTVNALFYNMQDFSIIDHVGGMKDLLSGRLKLIGEPELRYREDPVRMLRAVRFAAKLGFIIERDSLEPITELKEDILKANPSRLYEELQKLWISDEAEKGYQLMRTTGLFATLFPEVDEWLEIEDDAYPHTFLGSAFQWIEDEIREGRKVSPALLFAVILSGPIIKRAKELQEKTGAKFPVIFPVVKSLITVVRERISIPKRDTEAIKAILYGEQRFPQTRGKRPYAWLRNPGFTDAFRFFKMKKTIEGGDKELIEWWEQFMKTNQGEIAPPRKKGPPRKRRKRSYRKPEEKPA